ncbi:MAG: tetratricopeptide repeat protein [Candidatus Omnitrophota bacterium]|nr:tetratricopeptide repeat protein [Candidatus Omnitrophota bacterium]
MDAYSKFTKEHIRGACLKVLALAVAVLYYNNSYTQEEISGSETAVTEEREDGREMSYSELQVEYEKLKIDRDNILLQTSKMLKNKREYEQGLDTFTEIKKERDEFFEKNKELEKKIIAAVAEVEVLEEEAVKLEAEKTELESMVWDPKDKETVNGLIAQNKLELKAVKDEARETVRAFENKVKDLENALKDENKKWIAERRSLDKEILILKKEAEKSEKREVKLEEEVASLTDRLNNTEKDKKGVEEELLKLERAGRKVPVDFKNLARHNEILTQQLADTHYNMGVLFCGQEKFRKAIAEYEQVLKIKPTDKDAIYNLGLIYAEHEVDREKAIHYFTEYIQIDNRSTNAEWAKAYIMKWEGWQQKAKNVLR